MWLRTSCGYVFLLNILQKKIYKTDTKNINELILTGLVLKATIKTLCKMQEATIVALMALRVLLIQYLLQSC